MPVRNPPDVELWIRTLPSGDGEEHDQLRQRLRRLEARGVVDSVRVRTWPHEVALEGPATPRERHIRDCIRACQEWASEREMALAGFERITAGVGRMGPGYESMRLPQTLLTVWRDGHVEWVAPCVDDGHEWSPMEWVDEADTGHRPGRGPRVLTA